MLCFCTCCVSLIVYIFTILYNFQEFTLIDCRVDGQESMSGYLGQVNEFIVRTLEHLGSENVDSSLARFLFKR